MNPPFIISTAIILVKYISGQDTDYEYEYPEYDSEEDDAFVGEHHLVGGKKAGDNEIPFITMTDVGGDVCTGSLISSKWVLTAAHCTQMIKHDNAHEINSCLRQTRRKKLHFCEYKQTLCKCKKLGDGSIEYSGFDKIFHAWLGVKDTRDINRKNEIEKHQIKRIIRHKHTYSGSEAGDYEGYDVSLVELKDETERLFGCLPSAKFDDNVVSKTAGYGIYHREGDGEKVCQTDGSGKMRFHYCKKRGHGLDVCRKNSFPSQPRVCSLILKNANFSSYQDPITKKKYQKEIMIVQQTDHGLMPAFSCFDVKRQRGRSWCYTEDNFYFSKTKINHKNNWGYCSDDCFQNKEELNTGILRMKDDLDVLDDKICNYFLHKSLTNKRVVIPQILCVGYKKKLEVDLYLINNHELVKIHNDTLFGLHYADHFGFGFYVAGGGLCMGDSGGPLYVEKNYGGHARFIVTGVVSGGKGEAGFCGGVNNPTHYARVKMRAPWIGSHVQDICID